ncbi:hypothetical protein HNR00_003572 [Methylorubrum rhodinum]|uniref:Uncharacterized protein n=1 Tax=Methylorubrum rhodinum TaxID=29428 RepID=A0A840ZP82_9HYPH|nr:hypothetical protein [Methylorubrum rhodinum]MBB5758845.1 hypothetical protein [Methylorubrum rhodinum]
MAGTQAPAADTDEGGCIFEAPAGHRLGGARDCADELLPEAEWFGEDERRDRNADSSFEPDWSVTAKARS